MKKTLQSVAVAATMLLATNASAQLPDNGIYPGGLVLESYAPSAGYTGNHIYTMGSWKIDSILDTGTPVILDLFATWCGPCWTYHQGGALEGLYTNQGWGGPNNVAIFAVEADGQTAATKLEGGDKGDWINDTKYPMVNNDDAGALMNLSYYPTVIMICPDRSVTEVGQKTEAQFTALIQGCSGLSTSTNDPRVVANNTVKTVISCGGTNPSVEIKVGIQNNSNAAINGTYTVKTFDASNTEVATSDVTLDLAPYAAETYTVGSISAVVGTTNYTVKITTVNDVLTNDEIAVEVTTTVAPEMKIFTDNKVILEMDIDAYASEVGVLFDAGIPPAGSLVSIHNAAVNNEFTPIGFSQVGALADGASWEATEYTASVGCHYFMFVDGYDDGIVYQNPEGNATIKTNSETMVVPGNWDAGTFVVIDFVASVLDVQNEAIESLSIFPNPANEVANVSLTLTETSTVTISVVNALGQSVAVQNLGLVNGTQNVQVNTSNLEAGMYLVNVTVNGVVSTERISIVK